MVASGGGRGMVHKPTKVNNRMDNVGNILSVSVVATRNLVPADELQYNFMLNINSPHKEREIIYIYISSKFHILTWSETMGVLLPTKFPS